MCQPPENKNLKINEDVVIVMMMACDDYLILNKRFEFEFSKTLSPAFFKKIRRKGIQVW